MDLPESVELFEGVVVTTLFCAPTWAFTGLLIRIKNPLATTTEATPTLNRRIDHFVYFSLFER